MVLTNILHILGIIINLISIQKSGLKGIYWYSDNQILHIFKTHKEMCILKVIENLYVVATDIQNNIFVFKTHVALVTIAVLQSIKLLYNCLGYLNLENIHKLV